MMLKSPKSLSLVFLFLWSFSPLWGQITLPDPPTTTAWELKTGLDQGKWTVRQITEVYLAQIEQLNRQDPNLRAIISVNPDALAIADSLDRLLDQNQKLGILHGIPVVLKDNIESKDAMPTTAGSRALANNFSNRDSKVAEKLRQAGAIIIAKANLSEWANFRGENSISGWSAMGGFTRNPYVLSRNPCGSSSGSAVAVASGMAPLAVGTETNGSIICPAQANGVVGIKPTVGLISAEGIIPIAASQDVAGPIAKTINDATLLLEVLAEADTSNPGNLPNWPPQYWDWRSVESTSELGTPPLQGQRIGVYWVSKGSYPKVDSLFAQAQRDLELLGAELVPINNILPEGTNYASFQVMLYEYKRGLNQYFKSLGPDSPIQSIEDLIAFNEQDSVELQFFGQEYLKMAAKMDSSYHANYLEQLALMHKNSRELGIDKIMDSLDLAVIIAPSGGPAWPIDPLNGDHFLLGSSSPAAIAGYPNLSLPMGFIGELPVGLSIFGRALEESKLIQVASYFERLKMRRKAPRYLRQDPVLGE